MKQLLRVMVDWPYVILMEAQTTKAEDVGSPTVTARLMEELYETLLTILAVKNPYIWYGLLTAWTSLRC